MRQLEQPRLRSGREAIQNGRSPLTLSLGSETPLKGGSHSAKLKLLGVDVGGIGDAHGYARRARSAFTSMKAKEVYKRPGNQRR